MSANSMKTIFPIITIPDPVLRKQKFDEAWAELEPMIKDIKADPKAFQVLQQMNANALAQGLTE